MKIQRTPRIPVRLSLLAAFLLVPALLSQAQDNLYISPSTTMYVASDLVVVGNLVNKGTIETSSSGHITIYGDSLKNLGGTNPGSGRFDMVRPGPAPYNATGTQYIDGGGNASSFPTLGIYNVNNVKIVTTDTKVRDVLDLGIDGGAVVLGNQNMTVGNGDPGVINNYSDQRMIVTDGSGSLIREAVGASAVDFPVGIAEADYTPASVSNTSASSSVSVRVDNYSGSGLTVAGPNEGVDRAWNIQSSAVTGTVDLQHNTATEGVEYDNSAALVTRYIGSSPNTAGGSTSGSVWDWDGNSSAGSGTGTITTGSAISGASELARTMTGDFNTYSWFSKSISDHNPLDNIYLTLAAKAILQGPWNSGTSLMNDNLRVGALIPSTEPYTALTGFSHAGRGGNEQVNPSVFSTTGANAPVDWVLLELRSAGDNTAVLSTRAALIQADGDIVDIDGTSPVRFDGLNPASYFVVVKHRNHLGVMTASAIALAASPATVDFVNPATSVYGTNPLKVLNGSTNALWAGNANHADWQIIYSGGSNDPTTIFNAVLSAPGNSSSLPNYSLPGYLMTDVNMDGNTIYAGSSNDPSVIFSNILSHPSNSSSLPNFIITQQIP